MITDSKPTIAALEAAALLPAAAWAADAVPTDTEKRLEQRIEQMQQGLLEMQSELKQLKMQNETLSNTQLKQAAQVQQVAAAAPKEASMSSDLSLWGYGEVYYN